MIPKEISSAHVEAAIAEIDRAGVPSGREPTRYRLLHLGKAYPPKLVVSVAAKYAIGREWPAERFNGGAETNAFLQKLGFEIENHNHQKLIAKSTVIHAPRTAHTRSFAGADTQRDERHSQRCPECKDRILSLLRRLYGAAEVQKRFQIAATPEAFDACARATEIQKIFAALQSARGFTDFVRATSLPGCDFFVPRPGVILEFDESQHFTPLRELALSLYPSSLPVGFDREKWIKHCRRIRARDNDPVYRDEQRAWYDTQRDFLPTLLGLHPTIRLFAGEYPWCALNVGDDDDIETFRQILSESAQFWTIKTLGPEAARYARVAIDGAWAGDLNAARRLLGDVAAALNPVHRLTCLSTCGAFLRFEWPSELPPRGNLTPNLDERLALTGAAEKTVRKLLTQDIVSALTACCDYLTIGIDTKKDKISTTYNVISQAHAELVCLVALREGTIHWTGKFYPTPQQERSIVRFPELQSHFVHLHENPVMILGCHDLSAYSPRGQAKARGWRKKVSEDFRRLAVQYRPTVVLQHPHTTVKCRTWKQKWQRLEKEMPFIEHYLGTGAYSYRDDGWGARDDFDRVLDSTQRGEIMSVVVRLGVTE